MIELLVRLQMVCIGLVVVAFIGNWMAGRYDRVWTYLMVMGLGGLVVFGALAFVAPYFGADYPDW